MSKLSKKQKTKNYVLMMCVVAIILLIYSITIVKLSK